MSLTQRSFWSSPSNWRCSISARTSSRNWSSSEFAGIAPLAGLFLLHQQSLFVPSDPDRWLERRFLWRSPRPAFQFRRCFSSRSALRHDSNPSRPFRSSSLSPAILLVVTVASRFLREGRRDVIARADITFDRSVVGDGLTNHRDITSYQKVISKMTEPPRMRKPQRQRNSLTVVSSAFGKSTNREGCRAPGG